MITPSRFSQPLFVDDNNMSCSGGNWGGSCFIQSKRYKGASRSIFAGSEKHIAPAYSASRNMQILDDRQIRQKIKRIAIEILEHNFGEQEIILAGLNNNGLGFAKLLLAELQPIAPKTTTISLTGIRLNPANPVEYAPYIELSADNLRNKPIIIVDDVANTGRTIFYAVQPLLPVVPKKVEVAVLVDRKHKSFPVKADYVGLSLATTLLDNIEVSIQKPGEMAVFLV